MDKTIEFAHRYGFVETPFGRKCSVLGINDKNQRIVSFAERAAINAPIQGGAADIVKLAMQQVDYALNEKKTDAPKQETRKDYSKNKEFKAKAISPEINLLGCTVDEACLTLDKYLDECYLAGLGEVRIVHGKGTGALRQGVQAFLKTNPHVKSYRIGSIGEGDTGVTIVTLK
jgi:DNA mismatch repair protein MutS2